jgi:hypothetical protein
VKNGVEPDLLESCDRLHRAKIAAVIIPQREYRPAGS